MNPILDACKGQARAPLQELGIITGVLEIQSRKLGLEIAGVAACFAENECGDRGQGSGICRSRIEVSRRALASQKVRNDSNQIVDPEVVENDVLSNHDGNAEQRLCDGIRNEFRRVTFIRTVDPEKTTVE